MIPNWLLLKLPKTQRDDPTFMARLMKIYEEPAPKTEQKIDPELLKPSPADIEARIKMNKLAIQQLAPTLYPGKEIPYAKVGLLNIARRKRAKYEQNLTELETLKQSIKESNG